MSWGDDYEGYTKEKYDGPEALNYDVIKAALSNPEYVGIAPGAASGAAGAGGVTGAGSAVTSAPSNAGMSSLGMSAAGAGIGAAGQAIGGVAQALANKQAMDSANTQGQLNRDMSESMAKRALAQNQKQFAATQKAQAVQALLNAMTEQGNSTNSARALRRGTSSGTADLLSRYK